MLRLLAHTCVVVVAAHVSIAPLPPGYRYPVESDRTGDWDAYRLELPVPFHAEADFNGDGFTDEAWILLHESGTGWGLFLFLGPEDGSQSIITLDEHSGDTRAQQMGVSIAEPGEYETACGKGYGHCEPDEAEQLVLALPALDFFAYESANSFFWWDEKSGQFIRTWMSD